VLLKKGKSCKKEKTKKNLEKEAEKPNINKQMGTIFESNKKVEKIRSLGETD